MMYTYTWNHLLLFAQMCDCTDTKNTVTENWVNMLESHHEQVFPFTLWPLTYRTSAVIASTSLNSPALTSVSSKKSKESSENDSDACKVVLKIYGSNEVVIMCFQHVGNHEASCPHMCKFNSDATKSGHGTHSSDKKHPLVPCGLMNIYSRIKKKAMVELVKLRSPEHGNDFSCIICVGYGIGAVLATFMASDLSNEFRTEAEFMGLNKPSITVDCVCFSIPDVGNGKYWEEFNSLVDERVSVKHADEQIADEKLQAKIHPVLFVGNKEVALKNKSKGSFFNRKKAKSLDKVNVGSVPCSLYVREIGKTINIFDT
jgi:hypothetical protein